MARLRSVLLAVVMLAVLLGRSPFFKWGASDLTAQDSLTETYENEDLSLRYPTGWRISQYNEYSPVVLRSGSSDGVEIEFMTMRSLLIATYNQCLPVDRSPLGTLQVAAAFIPDVDLTVPVETTLFGQPALRAAYVAPDRAGMIVAIAPDGGAVVAVTATSAPDTWEQVEPLVWSIFDTVTIAPHSVRLPRQVLGGHIGEIRAMRISTDGARLLSVDDQGLTLVRALVEGVVSNDEPLTRLQIELDWPYEAVFSPDGAQLAVIAENAGISVWAIAAGEIVFEYALPDFHSYTAAFSLDSAYLGVAIWPQGGGPEQVLLFDTRTWQLAPALSSVPGGMPAFSSDSITLATSRPGADYPHPTVIVQLWNLASGQPGESWEVPVDILDGMVFDSHGIRLVIAAYNTVWVWDVQRVEELAVLHEPADHATALAVSPAGALLAVHHYNGVTRLWDLQTWELRAEWPEFNVREVAFSSDGTMLLTAAGPCIRAWDVAALLSE